MSDQEIRQALLREANPASRLSHGHSLTRGSRDSGPRNRPNRHFLTRVVAGVDSHNGHLKRQERERATRKFEILDRFIKEELERDENRHTCDRDHRDRDYRDRDYRDRDYRDRDYRDRDYRDRDYRDRYTGSRDGSVSSTGSRTGRVTRFDMRPPPEKLKEIQPSTSSTHNVKFSSVVDKIVRHHKDQAEARNKIYALTSIYNQGHDQAAAGLSISGLSGAEQVGTGYDEDEDYDKQSVTKRRKKRRRADVNRDESDGADGDREDDTRPGRSRERSRERGYSERRSSERRSSESRRSRDRSRENNHRSRSPRY
ncbi:YALI0B06985p [Yarrowia lipolytica CLIB122]|uniref:YALI0B06985p n=2 Tax=Yarrowia lipolytica TaxID=4952 RepID=Q6CFH2_YARLI|nr:YALI0B06985p [Yarrowia lipolytica CLIB122]AOW01334.1 hypothetical protein YALI1_B09072g [Yarrowia lipolytica]KAB8281838.1 hypothetical protein BKA91DRAFT_100903 [Yarrowia lipolytica]KAE8171609.1 hypothetical protein BKA90DRAFT_99477 [Yarrowia lipolytica]KAJ8052191.1 hypothetical protein LXG23DRAFT_25327 [Yarrowia lipolytica]CAG82821.1 YALI0B06985p [Yarrowia lipolytica CLIB122]|eukprot:XP_500590.1 YALI0B06985p [Yarrowia lipolytica CLIB122]